MESGRQLAINLRKKCTDKIHSDLSEEEEDDLKFPSEKKNLEFKM